MPKLYTILAPKSNKMSEFYTIFTLKIFFPGFWGNPPCPSVADAYGTLTLLVWWQEWYLTCQRFSSNNSRIFTQQRVIISINCQLLNLRNTWNIVFSCKHFVVTHERCVCACVCSQGICASIRNFNSRILQLDQESAKQTEIIYNQVGHSYIKLFTFVFVFQTLITLKYTVNYIMPHRPVSRRLSRPRRPRFM